MLSTYLLFRKPESLPLEVSHSNRTSYRLNSSLHDLYDCTDLVWGTCDVSQLFVEGQDDL